MWKGARQRTSGDRAALLTSHFESLALEKSSEHSKIRHPRYTFNVPQLVQLPLELHSSRVERKDRGCTFYLYLLSAVVLEHFINPSALQIAWSVFAVLITITAEGVTKAHCQKLVISEKSNEVIIFWHIRHVTISSLLRCIGITEIVFIFVLIGV